MEATAIKFFTCLVLLAQNQGYPIKIIKIARNKIQNYGLFIKKIFRSS
jgi:hypothetical protein